MAIKPIARKIYCAVVKSTAKKGTWYANMVDRNMLVTIPEKGPKGKYKIHQSLLYISREDVELLYEVV